MVRVTTDLPKTMDKELDALVAIGLYKSKSEALRDALRDLLFKYKDKIGHIDDLRKEMSTVKDKMSDAIIDARE
ncbi:MAG: ribbon-helix-helix protein, CopG family [Thermoplasmata archaeon]|nr:MAG: ribbon-helix-helix protein, CopG family [Thermoplasmata archaeon]